MTDEQLIKGCVDEDPVAQKLFYERFARKMMGVCLRYAQDQYEAEDILQDGFVKVFQKIGTFRGSGSLEGWVRRTIVNTALDNIRKTKIFQQHVDLDNAESLVSSEGLVLENIAANDLLKLICTLPTGYRTVFNMFAIEGYSHKEIADQLNISENTSKSQFRKAKAYLRKLMPGEKESIQ